LVTQLTKQSEPPQHIFVVGSEPYDLSEIDLSLSNLTVHLGRTGSAHQRNDGLAMAGDRFSYIVFFDDDFVPSHYWIERVTRLFESQPDIVGLTGIVLADGAPTSGIQPDDAQAITRQRDTDPSYAGVLNDRVGFGGNAGCNMAFRFSAISGVTFDERLPLYGWLEDADFRGRVGRKGRVVRSDALWGVHLGHKLGRSRGVQFGYSQIANALYLSKKGTVPRAYLAKLAARNFVSNCVRSLLPEPFVDRRGRLLGNMIAVGDLIRGRLAPERVLQL
jgi:GT2 family glycosyltransferase